MCQAKEDYNGPVAVDKSVYNQNSKIGKLECHSINKLFHLFIDFDLNGIPQCKFWSVRLQQAIGDKFFCIAIFSSYGSSVKFILYLIYFFFSGIIVGSVAAVIIIVITVLMVSVKFRNKAIHPAKEGYVVFCYFHRPSREFPLLLMLLDPKDKVLMYYSSYITRNMLISVNHV